MKKLSIVTAMSILLVSGAAIADNKQHDMKMNNNGSMMQSGKMNNASMMKQMQQFHSRLQVLESKMRTVETTHMTTLSPDDPVYSD